MTFDMADVKPSVLSWAIVGIMAVTFIVIAKYVTQRWYIPGVSETIQAV